MKWGFVTLFSCPYLINFFFHAMKVKGMTSDATGAAANVTQDVSQAKISTGRPWADAPIKMLVSKKINKKLFCHLFCIP